MRIARPKTAFPVCFLSHHENFQHQAVLPCLRSRLVRRPSQTEPNRIAPSRWTAQPSRLDIAPALPGRVGTACRARPRSCRWKLDGECPSRNTRPPKKSLPHSTRHRGYAELSPRSRVAACSISSFGRFDSRDRRVEMPQCPPSASSHPPLCFQHVWPLASRAGPSTG